MVVKAETKRHTVEAPCRRVHSSIGLYSPSWILVGLDFSPRVADSVMEGFYRPH